jgi:hypothetical protein
MRAIPILLLLSAALIKSCSTPPPSIPPVADSGLSDGPTADAPECVHTASCVCKKLCDLGCQDCMPECVQTVEDIIEERLILFDPQCILDATSKVDVRKCPGVRCP